MAMRVKLAAPSAPLANFMQTQCASDLLFVAGHLS
jgi:hypothetical protein